MPPLQLFSTSFSAEFDANWPQATSGARPHYAYPFSWGADNPLAVVIVIPPRWVPIPSVAEPWVTQAVGRHRFERVYTRPAIGFGTSVNFNYEIRSQFPLILSSTQQAVITSTITNP